MKNKSTKRAVVLSEFGGVDRRLPVGPDAAAESVNYRIMPDGSLKKRNGFKKLLTLPDIPSGIASVTRNGEKQLLAAAGDRIYSLDVESGTATALPGSLTAASEESVIIPFREKLLVLDGKTLSLVSDTDIATPTGYAPLYGRGWHPTDGGAVYEPINILSRNIRIEFTGVAGGTELHLPRNIESVTRIELGRSVLSPNVYNFNPETFRVTANHFARDGASIVVWCTFASDNEKLSQLNSCRLSATVGSGKDVTLFCSRTPECEHTVFRSTPVDAESLSHARKGFPDSDEFYFPESGEFSVGSDDLPVRAVLPLDDRVIVYNDDEAWLVSSNTEIPEPTLLCADVGCSSPGAAVICGDLPVSLCGNSVYCWEPDLEAYNELIAVCISSPVASLIDDGLAVRGRLITDRETRELWLYDPDLPTRPVLIYDRDAEHWYRFDGFSPRIVFSHGGRIGFSSGNDIFLFSPDALCDCVDGVNDRAVDARFVGGWLDLDPFEEQKSAARVAVKHDGPLELVIEYDSGAAEELSLDGSSPTSAPSVDHIRLRRERFNQLRLSFSSGGTGAGRVYSVALYAETDGGVRET